MAYTSEIEKLERRYAENPKGRNFAPLADAYRKAGQLDQAIELCKSGLERHPDYISAHIVFGRCLLDEQDDPGAEAAFRRVLELDPENVIAFKVLADLSERGERYDETVQWLTRLLGADPMNGDAADALAVAKRRAAEQAAVVPPPPPPPSPLPRTVPEIPAIEPMPMNAALADAETQAMHTDELVLEHPSVVTKLPDAPPPPELPSVQAEPAPAAELGAVLETFDGLTRFDSGAAPLGTEGIELQDEITLTPSTMAIEGLARTQYEGSGMLKLETPLPPIEPALEAEPAPEPALEPVRVTGGRAPFAAPPAPREPEALEDLPSVDLPLIMPEDVAEAPRRTRTTPPVPHAAPQGAPRVSMREVQRPAPDDDGAADTAALSRIEPVVTETMAELYLRQGHTEDAVRVYEALLAQRPGDERLREKLDSLTGRTASGQTVREFLQALFLGHAAPVQVAAVPEPSPEAQEVAVDVSSLSGAFAAAPADGEMPGQPSHPSEDALSLDQVFGDDPRMSRPVEHMAPPPPPPQPSAPRKQAEPVGQRTQGFSFDEFFDTSANQAPASSAPTPSPARPSVRAKAAAEDESDLDQFQAWLKGLKA